MKCPKCGAEWAAQGFVDVRCISRGCENFSAWWLSEVEKSRPAEGFEYDIPTTFTFLPDWPKNQE